MTKNKKVVRNILADENGKFFREKGNFLTFSRKSKKNLKIGGKSETGGKCIMASEGMDAPGCSAVHMNMLSTLTLYA